MDTVMIVFGLAVALMTGGPAVLLAIWALRRTRIWALAAAAAALTSAAWWIDLYLVLSAAGDLGGMFDCYPYCSASQRAAGHILFHAPLLMGAVLFILLLVVVIRHVRRAWSTDLGHTRAGC